MFSYHDEESGETVQLTEDQLTAKKEHLLEKLYNVQNELNILRLNELRIRKELIKLLVPSWSESSKLNGKAKFRVGCKNVVTVTYRNDVFIPTADDYKSVRDMLNLLRNSGEGGKIIAETLIRNTPSLNWEVYEKLPNELKRIVDKVVRIKSYCPYVEME